MNIELTQGMYAIVDDDLSLVEMLSGIEWQYDATTGYARNQKLYMHRMIALPDPDRHVDHINGNKLDNRRGNLRSVTPTQNSWNGSVRSDTRSGYRGVRVRTIRGVDYYTAGFKQDGRWVHIGSFPTAIDAAMAADEWAVENRGEYANLNFPNRYEE